MQVQRNKITSAAITPAYARSVSDFPSRFKSKTPYCALSASFLQASLFGDVDTTNRMHTSRWLSSKSSESIEAGLLMNYNRRNTNGNV